MRRRNSYSKYLLAYEIQARAYAAAMPQQGAAQEPSTSEASSQGESDHDGSAAAIQEAASLAAPSPDEPEAVSSGAPHVQPPEQPDEAQAEEGVGDGLVPEQPQGMEWSGGPDLASRPALEAEQQRPANADAEEPSPCLAGAHDDVGPAKAKDSGANRAVSQAERPHVDDMLVDKTPVEVQ